MSTVSGSTANTSTKYQRLSVEFVKLRNQVSTLKTALLDEQAKNEDQQSILNKREQKLRKLTSENESLLFRNEQLVKRVEALQASLDDTNATFLLAKNKKKHKEANLRIFGETSRQRVFNNSDPAQVMEQELERKLSENSELHSKIFDLEKQHEATINALKQRLQNVEENNSCLKKIVDNRCLYSVPAVSCSSTTLENSSEEEKNLKIISDFESQTEKSVTVETLQKNELLNEGERLNETYYLEKLKHLSSSLRHATGRAEYFKQECESLVRRNIIEINERTNLEKKLIKIEEQNSQLNDSLETTRQNYESQMRGLYEHMAEQDVKIIEQSDRLLKSMPIKNVNSVFDKKENSSNISQNLRKIVGK